MDPGGPVGLGRAGRELRHLQEPHPGALYVMSPALLRSQLQWGKRCRAATAWLTRPLGLMWVGDGRHRLPSKQSGHSGGGVHGGLGPVQPCVPLPLHHPLDQVGSPGLPPRYGNFFSCLMLLSCLFASRMGQSLRHLDVCAWLCVGVCAEGRVLLRVRNMGLTHLLLWGAVEQTTSTGSSSATVTKPSPSPTPLAGPFVCGIIYDCGVLCCV